MSGNSKLISFSVCWSISIFCWIAPGGEKQYSLYLWNLWFRRIYHLITEKPLAEFYRNSHREVFLRKNVLKICSKFTGEHLYQRVISIKLLYNFHSVKSVRIKVSELFWSVFSSIPTEYGDTLHGKRNGRKI